MPDCRQQGVSIVSLTFINLLRERQLLPQNFYLKSKNENSLHQLQQLKLKNHEENNF